MYSDTLHRERERERERDCLYYVIVQTYDVGLHPKRHLSAYLLAA